MLLGSIQTTVLAEVTRSEQKFEKKDIQGLWPVVCLKSSGLENSWSLSTYQNTIGVDAVWGRIRKASVINREKVVIKGEVGGVVCELFSEKPKEYIWRTESIRDLQSIDVYINVRKLIASKRVSKYFKLQFLDDYRFEISIDIEDFFTPEDADKIRLGQVLKQKNFYMIFKLNDNSNNNAPAFNKYTYDVLPPEAGVSTLQINLKE